MNAPSTGTPQASKPEEKPKSKKITIAAVIVGGIFIIFTSFASGVAVGLRKARFSYRWGENYERNFMGLKSGMKSRSGPIGGMMREFSGRDFRNAHGLAGTIISIADNNLVIKDRDNKENTIAVADRTIIRQGRDSLQISDLKTNDQVVVIGSPGDNGVINADLIRLFNNNQNN